MLTDFVSVSMRMIFPENLTWYFHAGAQSFSRMAASGTVTIAIYFGGLLLAKTSGKQKLSGTAQWTLEQTRRW
jgi:hypothetical protein